MIQRKILVTNDDGINSIGLFELVRALEELGEVWVVAPDRNRSGVSHALTLSSPLRLDKLELNNEERVYSTDGTPADCVYLTLSHLLAGTKVDLVVSGINLGFNLADDLTYSGTVAAALEAVLLDVPAIAVSLETFDDEGIAVAKAIVREIATLVLEDPHWLPRGVFLNVNIPKGVVQRSYKITTVGRRSYSKDVRQVLDPKGRIYYWIGGDPLQHDDLPGSDCNAVFDEGLISVTPIHTDMTHNDSLTRWKSAKLPGFCCVNRRIEVQEAGSR
jgi:5'-nucleotidase